MSKRITRFIIAVTMALGVVLAAASAASATTTPPPPPRNIGGQIACTTNGGMGSLTRMTPGWPAIEAARDVGGPRRTLNHSPDPYQVSFGEATCAASQVPMPAALSGSGRDDLS